MSEESRKFLATPSVKNCFVLLERLSENALNHYLRKQDSTRCKCLENRGSIQGKCELHPAKKNSRRRKERQRKSQEDCIQRKRRSRAKRLSFSDEEDESTPAISSGNVPEDSTTESTGLTPPVDVGRCEETSNPVPDTPEESRKNLKEISKDQELELMDMNGNFIAKHEFGSRNSTPKEWGEKESFNIGNEMKNINNDVRYKNGQVVIKGEVEIIEECNIERDRTIPNSVEPTGRTEFESEEPESRDEDEDDRETVIFEKNCEESNSVFENTQKDIEGVKENFKKKMMNRKKRRLVKFKKKRRMEMSSGKLKKRVFSKARGTGEELPVKEMCVLVKHIHELNSMILHLKKNLPKDSEQVDSVMRIINAVKKNFHREVKQSKKIIANGYKNMLKCYGNANKVSREIEKRTSLSKEQVADVIAWCLNTGRNSDERKASKETDKAESNVPSEEVESKRREMSEEYSKKLKRLVHDKIREFVSMETVQDVHQTQSVHAEKLAKGGPSYALKQNTVAESVSLPLLLSSSPSGQCPSKPPQRPSNEPRPKLSPGSGNPMPPNSHQHFFRAPAPQGYQEQRIPYSKPRPYFWPQKSSPMPRGPRPREYPQPNPTRMSPPGAHERHFRVRAPGAPHHLGFHSSANIPMNYPPGPNTDLSQLPGGVPPEHLLPVGNMRPALPSLLNLVVRPPVFNQERWTSHFPNTDGSVRYSCPRTVQNPGRPEYGSQPPQTNRRPNTSVGRDNVSHSRNVHPMSRSFENNAPRPSQTNYWGYVHPQTPTYPIRHPTVHTTPENPVEMYRRSQNFSAGPAVALEEDTGHTLDPTVPQKLTLRNWRLEAGPILEPTTESSFSECGEKTFQWHQPSVEESVSEETGNESGENDSSNGRVYMCAQEGCKNSGLRVCRGCQSVIYCSETCQLKHWTLKHKMECHQLKELRG